MRKSRRLLYLLNQELLVLTTHIDEISKNPEAFEIYCHALKLISEFTMKFDHITNETHLKGYMNDLIQMIYPFLKELGEMELNVPDLMETSSHLLDELVNQSLDFHELQELVENQGHTMEEIMYLEFSLYQKRKKENVLYDIDDLTPEMLIKKYYYVVNRPRFENVLEEFKKNYIENESLLEGAHDACEQAGLEEMYNYIIERDKDEYLNLFHIQTLHRKLFSHVPHPEFGGKFRNCFGFFRNTRISLYKPEDILPALNELFPEVDAIIEEGRKLGRRKDKEKILPYINRCIELNVKLIRIHPFSDGNGRTMRGFLNLLFSLANIPPVYIENVEKSEYLKAIDRAHMENDYTAIKKFYYYKICDSLIELDIEKKLSNSEGDKELQLKR